MKRINVIALTVLLALSCSSYVKGNETRCVVNTLTVNHTTNPLGIDNQTPLFSWQLNCLSRGIKQTAYQILVASSPELLRNNTADLWNSGKTISDETINIPYAGKALISEQHCFWKVKIWDQNGKESKWSCIAQWSMGFLSQSDWKAQWIGLDRIDGKDMTKNEHTRLSARMLRKEINVPKQLKQATAYVCGLGLFEWSINGRKVGRQVLAPALAEYGKRAYYMTFDVTNYLKKGQNAIGVVLGNGRYFSPRTNASSFGYPKLLFQLNLEYTDGSKAIVVSDPSWKLTTEGPIIANNEYDGEEQDATKEMPGWDKPGYNDSAWKQSETVSPGAPLLYAQPSAPIKVMETIKPVSVKELKPGVYIYDMGQNMVGWTRLKVKGVRGSKVSLRFAETLQPDGSLYVANLRTANVTDIYTLKGYGTEVFEPHFTYHGFRYVELTGYEGTPDLSILDGQVVYDNLPLTGKFETSNPMVNTIYKNAYWGIRGNYHGIPTDCPQRDERQGWLGDRAVGSKGESFVFDNSRLYAKWLQDIDDAQREDGSVPDVAPTYWKIYSDNVTWPAAYPVIANMLYDQYENITPIKTHYDSFRKWILYMKDHYLKDGILVKDTYGDWCMPPEEPKLIHSNDPARKTSGEILSTSYYYYLLTLMQRFAILLDRPNDVAEYKQLASTIYDAYNQKFFDKEKSCYGNNTATANLLSLAYNLVPDENKKDVFENVVNKTENDFHGHISTGLVGAQWIMRMLTQYGRSDIAYKLVTNKDYPSWGYMAEHGATTIWELWNGDSADPAMNSGNHVMLLGDLVIWFYEDLAGIKSDPNAPGFKHIIMNPTPAGDLSYVKASYNSVRGQIKSEWKKDEGHFTWDITIPANASATVYVPAKSEKEVKENGREISTSQGIEFLRMAEGKAVFNVSSGTYRFSSSY